MPRIDPADAPRFDGPGASALVAGELGAYEGRAIAKAAGFSRLGANVETLAPGSASSHRHWHDRCDELVVVLDGEVVLDEEDGETVLATGDIATFPAGAPNGHRLVNHSQASATFLVVANHDADDICTYSDIDLVLHPSGTLRRKDGTSVEV